LPLYVLIIGRDSRGRLFASNNASRGLEVSGSCVDAATISEDANLIELNNASASLANMTFYSRECEVDIRWVLRTSVAGETISCMLIR
jgi:hypothetical protein